jgi:hypothetical protein
MAQPSQFELSTEQYLVASFYIAGTVADVQFWTAPAKCEVVAVREIHVTAGTDAAPSLARFAGAKAPKRQRLVMTCLAQPSTSKALLLLSRLLP